METRGSGDWPARFKYVASSNSNHSWRQSICGEVVVVAISQPPLKDTAGNKSLDSQGRRPVQRPNWGANGANQAIRGVPASLTAPLDLAKGSHASLSLFVRRAVVTESRVFVTQQPMTYPKVPVTNPPNTSAT